MNSTMSARTLVVGALAFTLTAATPPAAMAKSPTAIAVKNWSFAPTLVGARAGRPMTLVFTSSEGIHGVASTALGIPTTTLPPGKPTSVTFTPKKPGTYVVHCAIVCGAGHEKMALTVKVTR